MIDIGWFIRGFFYLFYVGIFSKQKCGKQLQYAIIVCLVGGVRAKELASTGGETWALGS